MKVKRIMPAGKADVFNVTVEGAHTFIANRGFVTHNCDDARYFCMSRPVQPILDQDAEPIFYDPLNQFNPLKMRRGA